MDGIKDLLRKLKDTANNIGSSVNSSINDNKGFIQQGSFTTKPIQQGASNLSAWGNIAKQGISNQVNTQKQDFNQNFWQPLKQNPVLQPSLQKYENVLPTIKNQITNRNVLNPFLPLDIKQNWEDSKKIGAAALTTAGLLASPAVKLTSMLGGAVINPVITAGMNLLEKKPIGQGVVDSIPVGAGQGLANAGTTRLTNYLVQGLANKIPVLKSLTEEAIKKGVPAAGDTIKEGFKKLLNTGGKRLIKAAVLETAVESPIWATLTQTDKESYLEALSREAQQNLIMNVGMAGVNTAFDSKAMGSIIKKSVDTAVDNYMKSASTPQALANQGGYIDMFGNIKDGTARTRDFYKSADVWFSNGSTPQQKMEAIDGIQQIAKRMFSARQYKQLTFKQDPSVLIKAVNQKIKADIDLNTGYQEPVNIPNFKDWAKSERGGIDLTDTSKPFPQQPSISTPQNKPLLTREQYINQNGGELFPSDVSMVPQRGTSNGKWDSIVRNQNKTVEPIYKKNDILSAEYDRKIKTGEIIKPDTNQEAILIAQGNPNNPEVAAARKVLEIQGIDWKKEVSQISPESGLAYQGTNGVSGKAIGRGISLDNMSSKINTLADNTLKNTKAIDVIKNTSNNPNAKITVYRATPGNSINNGDWIFLTKEEANKFTKTAFGTDKPGFKVVEMNTTAKDIDWTGKNLEFSYNPKNLSPESVSTPQNTTLYRSGEKGNYFSKSKEYVQQGGWTEPIKELNLPSSAKILDATDYKKFNELATPEEFQILKSEGDKRIVADIQKNILKRNGYDGMKFTDEGRDGKIFETVFITDELKNKISQISPESKPSISTPQNKYKSANEFVDTNKTIKVPISDFKKTDSEGWNRAVDNVNSGKLSKTKGPIEVIMTPDGYKIIEGNHRAVQSLNSGNEMVDAVVISKEGLDKIALRDGPHVKIAGSQAFTKSQLEEFFNKSQISPESVPSISAPQNTNIIQSKSPAGFDNLTDNTFKTNGGKLVITEGTPNGNSVQSLFVDESSRRQGIATKLLDEAKKQYNTISAQVSNKPSVELHYKSGFRPSSNPNATLDQSLKLFDTGAESLNMVWKKPSGIDPPPSFINAENVAKSKQRDILNGWEKPSQISPESVSTPQNELLNEAKKYSNAEDFVNKNDPVKYTRDNIFRAEKGIDYGYEEYGPKMLALNLSANDLVKGKGITKEYTLNALKDAYENGASQIQPSLGAWTKEGSGFMDTLVRDGWVKKSPNGTYFTTEKIKNWETKSTLTDIWNKSQISPESGMTPELKAKMEYNKYLENELSKQTPTIRIKTGNENIGEISSPTSNTLPIQKTKTTNIGTLEDGLRLEKQAWGLKPKNKLDRLLKAEDIYRKNGAEQQLQDIQPIISRLKQDLGISQISPESGSKVDGGVNNKTFIHETNASNIDKFDANHIGTGQGDGWLGRGVYFNEKGSFKLEKYGKNSIETSLKPEAKIFDVKETPDGKWRDTFVEWFAKKNPDFEKSLESWQNPKNVLPRDLLMNKTADDEIIKQLKKEGYDGLFQDGELVVYNPNVVKINKNLSPESKGIKIKSEPTLKIAPSVPLEQPTGSVKLPWEEKGYTFTEAMYGGKPPKTPVNKFTQQTSEEATNALNFADIKANEDKGVFKRIFADWIGKKESAKTKATIEAQPFTNIPGKATDIIKAVENPKVKVSPGQEQYIGQLRQTYDKLYSEAKANGVDMGYIENYLTHEWDKPISQVKLDYKNAKQKFGFSNERTIPTYEEGIKMGLKPKYDNPAQILESYTRRLNETLANVELFKNLKSEGLIVGGGKVIGDPNFAPINAPGFPKATFQLGDGQKIISNWYAPKDIANQINRQFTPQDTGSLGKILKVGSKASGIVQDITLSGGLPKTPLNAWTIAQTTKEVLSGRVKSPLTSFVRSLSGESSNKFFSDNSGQIIKMQERNIPISTTFNVENLIDKGTVKNIFGDNIGSAWNKTMNEPTFRRFMPQLEINLFNDIEKSLLKKGIDGKQAADTAAQAVKNFYGIVGSNDLATRNKLTQDAVSTFFFAPRYRESMINFWVNDIKALKNPFAKENITNSKFVIGAVLSYLGMSAINKANTGNNMWDNPPGKEDKMLIKTKDGYIGVPFLSSIATMPRLAYKGVKHLVTGDIQEIPKDLKSSLSSSIRPAIDVFTNEDYFGGQIYDPNAKNKFADIGLYLAGQYNHPYIREAMNTLAQNLSPEVKSKLGLSKNAVPAYQTFSKAMELPFRFYNNKVGVSGQDALASSWYYASKDEAVKELDANQKQIYTTLEQKRPDDISQAANTQSEMAEALLLLSNPAILRAKAKTAIDTSLKTGESLDPFYSLTKEQQQVVLTLKTFYPGDKQKSTMQTSNIDWLKPYWTARSAYFDELTSKGVIAKQEPSEEFATPEMQKKLDYYYTLPYGTGARTQFINQNPDLVEYWDKKAAITNAKRAELGLEPLAGFTKYASSKSAKKIAKLKVVKPKKIASLKIKPMKIPKLAFKMTATKGKALSKFKVTKAKKLASLKLKKIKTPKITLKVANA